MKLKATQDCIFTLNESLKEKDFNKEVKIKIKSILRSIFIGKLDNNKEFEPIQLIYIPESIKDLNYIYHIKIQSAGLKYVHLAYVKATLFQHIQIWLVNTFIKFIINFENLFKILTVVAFLIQFFFNNKSYVNVYIPQPNITNINIDSLQKNLVIIDTNKTYIQIK